MVIRKTIGRVPGEALEYRIRTGAGIVRPEQVLRNLIDVGYEGQVRCMASDLANIGYQASGHLPLHREIPGF